MVEEAGGDGKPSLPREIGGSLGRAVSAAQSGDRLTFAGVLDTIGGWRGVLETTVPALLYILVYSLTQDARAAAISAGLLAILALVVRLLQRQTIIAALSGVLGVGIAVLVTLITGRGVDYFLWGFIVNAAWSLGLLLSLLVGWPLVGLIIGALRGSWSGWRREFRVKRMAYLLTTFWLLLFVSRLVVQFPMYLADEVEILGIARIVMGTPLFAVGVIVTWWAMRRLPRPAANTGESSDD